MKEIEKMMDILGVTNQAGISSKLGIPESTISAWISRGKIPGKRLKQWAFDYAEFAEWLEKQQSPEEPEHIRRLLDAIKEKIGDRPIEEQLGFAGGAIRFVKNWHGKTTEDD